MYRPSSQFRRTAAQRADQQLSWNRDDTAFFAAGACHILAFAFLATYPHAGFHPVGLWPHQARDPAHVYATNGTWAFDHDGWTPQAELLALTRAAEPDAGYQPRQILTDLETYCAAHNHRAREHFAHDPWQRALHYLAQFPPPETLAAPH
jgi:hypothetical protein